MLFTQRHDVFTGRQRQEILHHIQLCLLGFYYLYIVGLYIAGQPLCYKFRLGVARCILAGQRLLLRGRQITSQQRDNFSVGKPLAQ